MFKENFEEIILFIFGRNSNVYKAFNLVVTEMCKEKGYIRKFDGSDYYTHCLSVAYYFILARIYDQDLICAALLHDIIEDVDGYTFEVLEKLFNTRVATIVKILSKQDNINYKIDKNLNDYLFNISENMDASIIKAADRLHNMLTLEGSSKEYITKKITETENFFIPFINICIIKCDRQDYKVLFIYFLENIRINNQFLKNNY